MIEFITRHVDDISFWVIFAAAIVNYILLLRQKKAYRKLAESYGELRIKSLVKKVELNSVVNTVKDFIDEHNYWHDRKIRFYYDIDGWHCCYVDEMPQGDTFITEEEITPQNKNNNENLQAI